MNSNTTLAIFAIVAAFGLMTAMMVVEPMMQQAFALPSQANNRAQACTHQGSGNIPFCA